MEFKDITEFPDMDEVGTLIEETVESEDASLEQLPDNIKKDFFIYEIKKFIKGKQSALMTFSPNSVNVLIIEKDEFVKLKGYLPEKAAYEYQTKQSVTNIDGEVDIVQKNEFNLYTYLDIEGGLKFDNGKQFKYQRNKLYLISEYKIEKDEDIYNFGWLIQKLNYETPKSTDRNGMKIIELVDLETWSTRDGYQAILKIGKQVDTFNLKIIKFQAPSSFLLSNLKILGRTSENVELFPSINLKTELIPMWVNPIEVNDQGEVNLFNFWMTEDVLSWAKAKNFIKTKEINELIKDDNENTQDNTVVFEKDEISSLEIMASGSGKRNPYYKAPSTYPPYPGGIEWNSYIFQNELRTIPGSIGYEVFTRVDRLVIKTTQLLIKSTLIDLLLEVLTASFNYKNNFKGAGYKNTNTGELNEMAKYKQEFEGKTITEYIDGLEKNWEQKYPNKINSEVYKNYKALRAMLSHNIYGSLSINQGQNEDNKILLPWFFELQTNPSWTGKVPDDGNGIWKFTEVIKVKLRSSYFDLENLNSGMNKISLDYKISDSLVIKTNKDRFIWPYIPNQITETQLSSLSVKDFKLQDENIGKYIVRVPREWLKLFGEKEELFKLSYENVAELNNNKKMSFEIDTKLQDIKMLEISGIYGSGEWNIELIDINNKVININNISLFKINKQSISRLKMIL